MHGADAAVSPSASQHSQLLSILLRTTCRALPSLHSPISFYLSTTPLHRSCPFISVPLPSSKLSSSNSSTAPLFTFLAIGGNMATVMQTSLEGVRPQSHQGINSSPPASSPHIPRPVSQASLHLAPATNGGYSPSLVQQTSPLPFSAYPMVHAQPMRQFQHGNMALPVPHTAFTGSGFPNAQPMQYYAAPEQYFDTRGSQPMIRTISHAHPMTSATEHTASSRYSASPHSFTHEAPPTAGYPSFNFSEPDERHINPAIFNSFPMSRSTSGASDMADVNARLLTPSYDPPMHYHEAELRKVSDSLGSLGRIPSGKYHGNTLSPHMEVMSPNIGLGPHSQPDMGMYVNAAKGWGSDFALSAERGKNDMPFQAQADTDYERERAEQIMNNKKLLEDIGLGGDNQVGVAMRHLVTG